MFPFICFICENVCQASKLANEINNIRIGLVLAKNNNDNNDKHVIALTTVENGCDTTPLVLVSHVVNGNLKAKFHIFAEHFTFLHIRCFGWKNELCTKFQYKQETIFLYFTFTTFLTRQSHGLGYHWMIFWPPEAASRWHVPLHVQGFYVQHYIGT